MAAEKLNMKAAEKILSIRNDNNNIWKMDLHGLHASEAVSALKERLHQIESHAIMSRSSSSDGLVKLEAEAARLASSETLKGLEKDSDAKMMKALPQQRQTVLQVITGVSLIYLIHTLFALSIIILQES